MERSLYDVLGVNPSASAEEIEAACIKLGEQFSPERNKGNLTATIRFKEIEQAYETLSDPEKRAAYDQDLKIAKPTEEKPAAHSVVKNASHLTGFGILTVTFGIVFLLSAMFHGNVTGYGAPIFAAIGLSAIIGANIWFKEKHNPADDSVPPAPTSLSTGMLVAFTGAMFGYVFAVALPSQLNSQKPSPKPKASASPINSDAVLDSCFIAGKLAAELYIANFVEMAKNDYLASDLMRDSCAKKGAAAPNPNSCVNTCELGFKAAARKALK